ncbi:uncharacterized protein LOC111872550, partial [Cryptotermes secundus]|uniref:uncharacterized protein LOC111872550 n=1 Tax=Cryptotermes secundus TaxID=105785 RepID=UPI001454D995
MNLTRGKLLIIVLFVLTLKTLAASSHLCDVCSEDIVAEDDLCTDYSTAGSCRFDQPVCTGEPWEDGFAEEFDYSCSQEEDSTKQPSPEAGAVIALILILVLVGWVILVELESHAHRSVPLRRHSSGVFCNRSTTIFCDRPLCPPACRPAILPACRPAILPACRPACRQPASRPA